MPELSWSLQQNEGKNYDYGIFDFSESKYLNLNYFKYIFKFYVDIFQDRAWGDHWDEAIGDKMELNPHIPKPEPPVEEVKEEEKKEAEEAADDNKKEEDKEKVTLQIQY